MTTRCTGGSQLRIEKNQEFREILQSLSEMEHRHYDFWKRYIPAAKVEASAARVYLSILMRVLFGTTFASKFLDRNESSVIKRYKDVAT